MEPGAPVLRWIFPAVVGERSWGAGDRLVLVVTDDKGMQELASGKLKMGIQASIAGRPVGVHASTVTTNADIFSYSRSRGLFAGTNLDGSAITEDEDDARSLYGSPQLLIGHSGGQDASSELAANL